MFLYSTWRGRVLLDPPLRHIQAGVEVHAGYLLYSVGKSVVISLEP